VVLFDEIEKADPAAFDLLLGVIGDGRLTDALGRLIDFRMALIVMTTNLGAGDAAPSGFAAARDGAIDHATAIRKFFRPELLGRIDATISFRSLDRAALERVVELELSKLAERPGFVARAISLRISPAARARLAELGYDKKLGARPLRRTLEDLIVAPLADRMASDPLLRATTILIQAASEPGAADLTIP
jgi:ATP-dependent Clp protease ATP-binding subunit ClpC